jgi:hypothetical protein
MMKFPLPDGGTFAVIEPGNIQRLKDGRAMHVGNCLIAFTPDMQKFAEMLGASGNLPERGQERVHIGHWTPEQIDAALQACQKLPEVAR